MLCSMYIWANSKNESKEVSKKILSEFKEFILEVDIVENMPYWKIEGIYEIGLTIKLNNSENEIRKSKEWHDFLKTISNKWEFIGNNQFIASKKNVKVTYMINKLEFINIFIGDDN